MLIKQLTTGLLDVHKHHIVTLMAKWSLSWQVASGDRRSWHSRQRVAKLVGFRSCKKGLNLAMSRLRASKWATWLVNSHRRHNEFNPIRLDDWSRQLTVVGLLDVDIPLDFWMWFQADPKQVAAGIKERPNEPWHLLCACSALFRGWGLQTSIGLSREGSKT